MPSRNDDIDNSPSQQVTFDADRLDLTTTLTLTISETYRYCAQQDRNCKLAISFIHYVPNTAFAMRPPGGLLFEPPINWIDGRCSTSSSFFTDLSRRDKGAVWDIVLFCDLRVHLPESRDQWFQELFFVSALETDRNIEPAVLEGFGRILCQALEVQQDCCRELLFHQCRNFLFFTNHRAIQVYCWHNDSERNILQQLISLDTVLHRARESNYLGGQRYEKVTEKALWRAHPYLAWECIFRKESTWRLCHPAIPMLISEPNSKPNKRRKDHSPN